MFVYFSITAICNTLWVQIDRVVKWQNSHNSCLKALKRRISTAKRSSPETSDHTTEDTKPHEPRAWSLVCTAAALCLEYTRVLRKERAAFKALGWSILQDTEAHFSCKLRTNSSFKSAKPDSYAQQVTCDASLACDDSKHFKESRD